MNSAPTLLRRRVARAAIATAIVAAPALVLTAPAEAHPLGNATVSHYDGLTLAADHIDDFAVEDSAEIPTVARESGIDVNGDGTLSDAERASYAATQCSSLATGVHVTAGTRAVTWQVRSSAYTQRPGAAGLPIGRLECRLRAAADLSAATSVVIEDNWDGAGIGWHEITAVGDGVALTDSPVPAASISQALLAYPNDMLSSPLNVRSATLRVTPGGTSTYTTQKAGAQANWAVRTISKLTATLDELVKGRLDLGVGVLAVLLAILLGAGHAMLPGHGKTIMAAYLVGKRGRLRDVVTVGATVTVTHTAGVLVLGTLISLSATFAPTAVEQWLGVVSGLIVVMVGLGLLVSAVRRRRADAATVSRPVVVLEYAGDADAAIAHFRDSASGSLHPQRALASGGSVALLTLTPVTHRHGGHEHGPGGHQHGPGGHQHVQPEGFSRGGLIGLGAAGGLVPSPSAL
ncbi:MAG: nickel/cobalt transporter (NicO) family protein, partial [Frankiaceae bacterium]|nr:nickel/cobalt transporter (NicO) family protein [Frankiaceae bacterium]